MTMMRRVALIALAGFLVVVAGWYLVFWRSESSHLRALKAQESKAAANVSQLESQLSALRVLQREVPAEKAAIDKLDQDIPQGRASTSCLTPSIMQPKRPAWDWFPFLLRRPVAGEPQPALRARRPAAVLKS